MAEQTPTQIAANLTKAQRRAALTNDDGFADQHKGKWAFMTTPTAKIMFDLGLIETPESISFPTPLGLAVRAILRGEAS